MPFSRLVLTALCALVWSLHAVSALSVTHHLPRRSAKNEAFNTWLAHKARLPLKVSDYETIANAYQGKTSGVSEDVVRDLLPYIVRELLHELERADALFSSAEGASSDDDSADNEGVGRMRKRKAFWQPLRGPLPVETRFANFGSRLEPEKDEVTDNNGNIMKAMRYGKK